MYYLSSLKAKSSTSIWDPHPFSQCSLLLENYFQRQYFPVQYLILLYFFNETNPLGLLMRLLGYHLQSLKSRLFEHKLRKFISFLVRFYNQIRGVFFHIRDFTIFDLNDGLMEQLDIIKCRIEKYFFRINKKPPH